MWDITLATLSSYLMPQSCQVCKSTTNDTNDIRDWAHVPARCVTDKEEEGGPASAKDLMA